MLSGAKTPLAFTRSRDVTYGAASSIDNGNETGSMDWSDCSGLSSASGERKPFLSAPTVSGNHDRNDAEGVSQHYGNDATGEPAINPLYTRIKSWMDRKGFHSPFRPSENKNSSDDDEQYDSFIKDSCSDATYSISRRSVRYCVYAGFLVVLISAAVATGVSYGVSHAVHKDKDHRIPGECMEWSPWGSCSTTCGIGVKTRNHTCYGNETQFWEATYIDSLYCSGPVCLDPWSEWGKWTECSVTCGAGARTRNRTCAGDYCGETYTGMDVCSEGICFDPWSEWGEWSDCSVTCGAGARTRNRTCEGDYCGETYTDMDVCSESICIDAWSLWSNWGGCSVTCGTGQQSRTRTCTGKYCGDNDMSTELCQQTPCISKGQWSYWGTWGPCSVSCGCGLQARARTCSGGDYCDGDQYQSTSCTRMGCGGGGGGGANGASVIKPTLSASGVIYLGTLIMMSLI